MGLNSLNIFIFDLEQMCRYSILTVLNILKIILNVYGRYEDTQMTP